LKPLASAGLPIWAAVRACWGERARNSSRKRSWAARGLGNHIRCAIITPERGCPFVQLCAHIRLEGITTRSEPLRSGRCTRASAATRRSARPSRRAPLCGRRTPQFSAIVRIRCGHHRHGLSPFAERVFATAIISGRYSKCIVS